MIELHPVPEDALAVLRNGFEVTEAPLTPEEFRNQVDAALIAKADRDAWLREKVPRLSEPGDRPEPDLPEPDRAIWRRLEVRSDVTLAGLHRILAAAFDRDERQDHRFETAYGGFSADTRHGEGDRLDDEVTLGQVTASPGHRLVYEVDRWKHWIRVERLVAIPEVPACLDGERAAPPAECDDEQDYEMLLEALRHPYDEDSEDLIEELGAGFDPESFDRKVVNERLSRLS